MMLVDIVVPVPLEVGQSWAPSLSWQARLPKDAAGLNRSIASEEGEAAAGAQGAPSAAPTQSRFRRQ